MKKYTERLETGSVSKFYFRFKQIYTNWFVSISTENIRKAKAALFNNFDDLFAMIVVI